MDYRLLVRKNYILDGGIQQKDVSDVIVPFSSMEVAVLDTFKLGDKVTLCTEDYVDNAVANSVVNSHKVISGELEVTDEADATAKLESYANGGDLIFTNARKFNKLNATPGEVFFIIPAVGSSYKAEEVIVGAKKDLILLSNENDIFEELEDLENLIEANATSIALKESTINVDAKIKVETDARIAEDTRLEGLITADKADLATYKTSNDARVLTAETQVAVNKTNADDYIVNKADFVRVEDLQGAINIIFAAPIVMTEDGNDVVADLTALDPAELTELSKFRDDNLMIIQASPNAGVNFPVEYTSDSWNNGMATANTVLGRAVSVQTTFTADGVTPVVREVRLSGLNNNDRTDFIRDFTITKLSQVSSTAGAGIDNTARSTATAAQASATQANAKADANETRSKQNESDIAGKQDKIDQSISDGIDSTNTKSVVGAINALHGRAKNNEVDIDELNEGNFDVKGDGTVVQKLFDANGDLVIGQVNGGKLSDGTDEVDFTDIVRLIKGINVRWTEVTADLTTRDWTNDLSKRIRITYTWNGNEVITTGIIDKFGVQYHARLSELNTPKEWFSASWNTVDPTEINAQTVRFGTKVIELDSGNPYAITKFEILDLDVSSLGLATEQFVKDEIAKALSAMMDVTFDDSTTGAYKIGE